MKLIQKTDHRTNIEKLQTTVAKVERDKALVPIGIFKATISDVVIFTKQANSEKSAFVKVTFEFEQNGEMINLNRNFPLKWFPDSYLLQFPQSLEIEVKEGQEFDFVELLGLDVQIMIEEVENFQGAKYNCVTAIELV